MSPAPPVPAQVNGSMFTEERGSKADDVSTSDRGGGRVVDEMDDCLASLKDLDVAWGSDLESFLHKRTH